MPQFTSSKTIAAQNTFSDPFAIRGYADFSLSGTWVATVHLQRSFDDGTTWLDVGSWTANDEHVVMEPVGGVLYRFGVKTGNYTSGSIVGALYR